MSMKHRLQANQNFWRAARWKLKMFDWIEKLVDYWICLFTILYCDINVPPWPFEYLAIVQVKFFTLQITGYVTEPWNESPRNEKPSYDQKVFQTRILKTCYDPNRNFLWVILRYDQYCDVTCFSYLLSLLESSKTRQVPYTYCDSKAQVPCSHQVKLFALLPFTNDKQNWIFTVNNSKFICM